MSSVTYPSLYLKNHGEPRPGYSSKNAFFLPLRRRGSVLLWLSLHSPTASGIGGRKCDPLDQTSLLTLACVCLHVHSTCGHSSEGLFRRRGISSLRWRKIP